MHAGSATHARARVADGHRANCAHDGNGYAYADLDTATQLHAAANPDTVPDASTLHAASNRDTKLHADAGYLSAPCAESADAAGGNRELPGSPLLAAVYVQRIERVRDGDSRGRGGVAVMCGGGDEWGKE